MAVRSKYIKKKYGIKKSTRRKRPVLRAVRWQEHIFDAAVIAALIVVVLLGWMWLRPKTKIKIDADRVAAFHVPPMALRQLKDLSAKHGVNFPQLFTLYCVDNDFFPNKAVVSDLNTLEQQYALNYDKLKNKYQNIQPYNEMFRKLFDEIQYFPIPAGYGSEENASYMFGDSWGVTRNFEGDKSHRGTDLLDRENIRGRIPIVSMTDGTVQEAGWHEQRGYTVSILTENDTQYLYAHLDSLDSAVIAGEKVRAGQPLGSMGDSGFGKEGVKGKFQVHLHIGISPQAGFIKNKKNASNFWINPYPLLRYIEDTKADLPDLP